MQHKLRRFLSRAKRARVHVTEMNRSRDFLNNILRKFRWKYNSSFLRGSLGFIQHKSSKRLFRQNRLSPRLACFLTGRNRSYQRRYDVSRMRIKTFSDQAVLIGTKKASW